MVGLRMRSTHKVAFQFKKVGEPCNRGRGRSEGRSFSHFWEFSLKTAERQDRSFHIYKKEDMQQADEVTGGTVGCTM